MSHLFKLEEFIGFARIVNKNMDVLYRYEIEYRSEDGDTRIVLRELPVIRETYRCYFIKRHYFGNTERRVLKRAMNTYAYDTKEMAKDNFIRRTKKEFNGINFGSKNVKKVWN